MGPEKIRDIKNGTLSGRGKTEYQQAYYLWAHVKEERSWTTAHVGRASQEAQQARRVRAYVGCIKGVSETTIRGNRVGRGPEKTPYMGGMQSAFA